MKKNHDRKAAEELFLEERGRISNKEISIKLGVHPASVARWKKLDEWDLKLVQAISEPCARSGTVADSLESELRHLALLNEKIERYLERSDLLPSEIRDLAQAKRSIIDCREILSGNGSDEPPF